MFHLEIPDPVQNLKIDIKKGLQTLGRQGGICRYRQGVDEKASIKAR